MPGIRSNSTLLILILVQALATVSCRRQRTQEDLGEKPSVEAVPVEAVKVKRGPISSFILASSTVKSISQVEVLAEVTGIVAKVYREEGDRVKKGRLLALIRNPLLRIAYDKAKLNVEKLKRDRQATKRLMDKGISSKSQYEEIDFRYRQALIDLKRAREDRTNLWVTAPVSGVISSRTVKRGERAVPNKQLFSIVNPWQLEVDVYLPEKHLPQVKDGQEARILATSLNQKMFCGLVKRISPIVDKVSGTVKVTVQVRRQEPLGGVCPPAGKKKKRRHADKPKPAHWLRPGMYVDVRIITRTAKAVLIVPRKALIYEEAKSLIYVIKGKKARRKQVHIGDQYKNMVEIRSGLKEGDLVIIVGHHGLKEGAQVKIVNSRQVKTGVKDKARHEAGKGPSGMAKGVLPIKAHKKPLKSQRR